MHGVSNHHRREVLPTFERLTTWLPRACSMAPKGVSRKCPEMLGNPRIPLHFLICACMEHNTAEEVWKEDYQRREAIEEKMLQ
jgi:hypothetical protein